MPSSRASGRAPRAASAIEDAVARLRDGGTRDLALVDLISLAEHAVSSMQAVFAALDASILREFDAIADSIARAREDIGRLRPRDLSHRRIPDAGRELAAVVEATEDATHRIMAAAERMLEADTGDPAAYRALVEREATRIFEACSFQDITGQRVSRVVETLEDIEERVGRIARTLGTLDATGGADPREQGREARRRERPQHGPQPGADVQDDIDRLLRNS